MGSPPSRGRLLRGSLDDNGERAILAVSLFGTLPEEEASMNRTATILAALGIGAAGLPLTASAQNEQFVPANFYWVGPYAPGGSGFGGGIIDYMAMLNERDGGINGVKLTWEKCETEYNNARGVECYERSKKKGPTGATVIHPLSTGITYSLIEKATADRIPIISMGYGRTSAADGRVFPYVFPLITTYWSQATVMVKFMGQKLGGMDKLKGKKIVLVYHDSAYGKEPIPILTDLSKQYGYEFTPIAVPHPGNEQQSQWLQVRQIKPDYVILWGWGVMNPTALKAAAKIGYPRDKIIGVWWSGAEEDVIPAGAAAKGYISAGFNAPGSDFPVMRDIQKYVYAKGKGEFVAQSRFGKGKPITGEQMRWGIENLNIDEKRLKELGAVGMMPPIKVSCMDHEGSGLVKFQQWDGAKWKVLTDWMEPDRKLVRSMVEADASQYAKEKGITPRN